jgi:hypothetical protein
LLHDANLVALHDGNCPTACGKSVGAEPNYDLHSRAHSGGCVESVLSLVGLRVWFAGRVRSRTPSGASVLLCTLPDWLPGGGPDLSAGLQRLHAGGADLGADTITDADPDAHSFISPES